MASSQVEIASSNPFVCVSRNQNKIPSQPTTFHKNLKGLVRDRLHTRISVPPDSPPDENPRNHETGAKRKNKSDNVSTWIGSCDKDNPSTLTQGQLRNHDKWAALRAREMVSTIDAHNQDEDVRGPPSPIPLQSTSTSLSEPSSPSQPQSPHKATTPVSAPNRGASSLVQIWEARLGRSASLSSKNNAAPTEITVPSVSRSSSSNSSSSSCNFPLTNTERTHSNDEPPSQFEPSGQTKFNDSSSCSEQTPSPSQKSKIIDRESDPTASSSYPDQTSGPSQKSKAIVRELDPASSSSSSEVTCVPSQKCKIAGKVSDQTAPNESSKLTSTTSQKPKKANKESDQMAPNNSSEMTSKPSHKPKTDREDPDQTASEDSSSSSELPSKPRQRPKIANLIRRLMAANSSNTKKTTTTDDKDVSELSSSSDVGPDHPEKTEEEDCAEGSDRAFVPNINHCPRLRGRKAFNDLLLMMEHDRYSEVEVIGERQAVSRFSHKGRIQSILRLKILQRGLSLQEGWLPHSRSTKPNHSAHASTVHLRGKSTNVKEQTDQPKEDDIGSSSRPHSAESSCTNYNNTTVVEEINNGETESDERESGQVNPESSCSVITIPTEDVPEPSYSGWYQEWPLEEGGYEEEEVNRGDAPERFLGVVRPRSYWEDRRKEWYRQILAPESDDSEIRQLLQRKSVSSALTTESDFHQRMNNLMKSHVERQIHNLNYDEDDETATSSLETMRRFLSSYLQQQSESIQSSSSHEQQPGGEEHQHAEEEEEDDEDEDEEDEDEDEDMFLRRQERMEDVMLNQLQVDADEDEDEDEEDEGGEVIDEAESINVHQNTSSTSTPSQPSPIMRNNDGGGVGVMSASLQGSESVGVGSYRRDEASWSVERVSMEMELIIELRGQIQQLYQEMSELRRCMSNCVDVQVKFQDSIKQEMMSVRGGLRRTEEQGAPRKGYCCICYEMKVNSLLYRCGHMCTCLECAHELQLGSGKCPICRSTILDVVKAYAEM